MIIVDVNDRGTGRPKLMSDVVVKKDMNLLDLTKHIVIDRSKWKKRDLYSRPKLIGTQGLVLFDLIERLIITVL